MKGEQHGRKREELFEALIKENKSQLTKTITLFAIDELGLIIDRIENEHCKADGLKSQKGC